MSDKKIRFMVTAAVMAALTYVATTVVRIPAPTGGYVHMGDGLVLLCGWILARGGAARLPVSGRCWWICWAGICPLCPARWSSSFWTPWRRR